MVASTVRTHPRSQRETELGKACLRALEPVEGLQATFKRAPPRAVFDWFLDLRGEWGKARYAALVTPRVTAENVGMVVQALAKVAQLADQPPALLTWYINPSIASLLRAERIDFLDAAGNASLRRGALYVWVTGERPEEPPQRANRAFQATGLRLIALLLEKPEAVAWTYRALAEASGISLGAVGPVLEDLRSGAYLRMRKGARMLVKRRALFERWELGYVETLRPRLLRRTCRLAEGRSLDDLEGRIESEGLGDAILLGGEMGAARLTRHLRPARATLHLLRGAVDATMVRLRLLPDPAGAIDILDAITPNDEAHEGLASPLLIHAELLRGTPDSRLRETAELVYERHLRERLEDPA